MPDFYALPSNGWRPGLGPSHAAARSGAFHAELVDGRVDARVGDREPMLWPDGWRVMIDPTRLIAPDGTVVATEGDHLRVAGGLDFDGRFSITSVDSRSPAEWTAQQERDAADASARLEGRYGNEV